MSVTLIKKDNRDHMGLLQSITVGSNALFLTKTRIQLVREEMRGDEGLNLNAKV